MSTKANEILHKYFGYEEFREGQESLVASILNQQDTFGIMPTGAGKSICYQVPALMMEGITLVISPLISLMKDQVQALNQAGVHAAFINSSLSFHQTLKALAYAKQNRYKIIYVAPERLETESFLDFVLSPQVKIDMIAIDEAHCISQWGQDFRPSYLKIVSFINRLPLRPVISAFTATATQTVREDVVCILGLQNPNIVVTGFDRKNLYFEVQTIKSPKDKDAFIRRYISEHPNQSGVIYCNTRKAVEEVFLMLQQEGILVTRYHAGLTNEERHQNQEAFIFDQKPIIVATNAFGMGIDKSNVRFVIHYNMPQNVESYYQEAGRAGRDGENAECILLYSARDVMVDQYLIENRTDNEEMTWEDMQVIKERDMERLKKMTFYCTTKNCLRDYMLRYFGEYASNYCGNCSNCLTEFEEIEAGDICRKILGCIQECRGRYGINVIVGTLRGLKNAKLNSYNMNQNPFYGVCSQISENRMRQICNYLEQEGYLYMTNDKYALVKLHEKSKEIMESTEEIRIQCAPDVEKKAKDSSLEKKAKARRSDVLTSRGMELFETLRSLRSDFARQEGMPPYIIFSDKTLQDMCIKLPFTEQEMLNVNGVGENKYKKYGEEFIQRIVTFTGGRKEVYYFE